VIGRLIYRTTLSHSAQRRSQPCDRRWCHRALWTTCWRRR